MNIAGVSTSGVEQLLGILTDPERFAAALAELQAAGNMAEEQIALAGPANEVIKMRDELRAWQANKGKLDAEAEEGRRAIIDGAKADAKALREEARKESAELTAQAQKVLDDAVARQSSVSAAKAISDATAYQLRELERGLDVQRQQQSIREAALNKQAGDVEAERLRLVGVAKAFHAELEA